MFKWIKNLFLFLLGAIASLFVLFAVIIFFFKSLSNSNTNIGWVNKKEKPFKIELNSCLIIPLQQSIAEQGVEKFSWNSRKILRQTSIHDFIRTVRGAQQDERIQAVWLKIDPMFSTSWTLSQELRNALLDFKKTGKKVYVSADFLSTAQYYLASVADQVYLTSEGYLLFNGLGVYISFYKKLLDQLGIDFFVARGRENDYKSYAEPFMYDKMSAESKGQYNEILKNHWHLIVADIAKSRNISEQEIEKLSNENSVFTAKEALITGLIDGVFYEDQIRLNIKTELKDSTKEIQEVGFRAYLADVNKRNPLEKEGNIAILYANGEIAYVASENNNEEINKDFVKKIKKISDNEAIKAVVLRVNSPGGASLTSDLIWHELQLLKEKKKLVVSMGEYAASGGYYIAMPAHQIVAAPFTITGSIGVFAIFPTAEKLFQKIGINFDGIQTSENANLMKGLILPNRVTETQKKIIQNLLANTYDGFIQKVAEDRSSYFKNAQEVHKIARGQVWTATKAKEIGLIDTIGNLDLAIQIAANLAKIEQPKVFEYQEKENWWSDILLQIIDESDDLSEDIQIKWTIEDYLLKMVDRLRKADIANPISYLQARLPYEIEIK